MAGITALDLITSGLRLILVLLLYLFVLAVLQALRRDVLAASAAGGRPGSRASSRARGETLTLLKAGPADGPVGRVVPLLGATVIGRRPGCDIDLHDDAVSATHARLRRVNDAWQVEDLHSTNGTFRNGRRITSPEMLRPGDVIATGLESWRFDGTETED